MDRKWMQLLRFLSVSDQTHRKHIVQTFKPTPESSSFHQPSSDMNVASGCPQFAKLTVFDEDCYVNNDVMFIKCIVDTTKIFHP
jgi:TNF receptor-associated factor 2/TNF receptor-associated factor 3